MAGMPTLSDNATRVLRFLDDCARRGQIVRGAQVIRTLGLTAQELVGVLDELDKVDLVSVSGQRTPERIDLAVVSIHPSNRGFVRSMS